MSAAQSTGPLWRLPRIAIESGLSKSEIYRRIKSGTFPKPLKLGARAVAWSSADIEAWKVSLVEGASK